MKIFCYLIWLSTIFNFSIYPQHYEKLKESAERYLAALSSDNPAGNVEFINLKQLLYDMLEDENSYQLYQTSERELDSLKNHLNYYESILNEISADSALTLFNQWYLHFANTFYNYADEKFFSSEKIKILFFSASMSCQCTLDMCKRQTIEILNFAKENNIDCWIIDSFEHNELQIRYETLFAPSVILIDESNNMLFKIEYDEDMILKFSQLLNKVYKNNLRG